MLHTLVRYKHFREWEANLVMNQRPVTAMNILGVQSLGDCQDIISKQLYITSFTTKSVGSIAPCKCFSIWRHNILHLGPKSTAVAHILSDTKGCKL